MGPRGPPGPAGSSVRLFLVFNLILQNVVDLFEQTNQPSF